jgi:prepilin-type N-terminal cleavage/methylation domain-containing protein
MKPAGKRGFTLVEIMLATIIAVMVFAAMGMVLNKGFSLWLDSMANWRLSQYARISREHILRGGFADPKDGLMAATNITITSYGGQDCIEYRTLMGTNGVQRIAGWNGSSSKLWLNQGSSWLDAAPTVELDSFAVNSTNRSITYRLKFSAAGKTFKLSQTIQTTNVFNFD